MSNKQHQQVNDSTKIKPIEDLVFAGLIGRLSKVFDSKWQVATAMDKIRQLQKTNEGAPLQYPYGFVNVTSTTENIQSYNARYFSRTGLDIVTEDGFSHRVRLLPTRFEIDIEFITNDYNQVRFFVKRWLMARRLGLLKFNIEFGNYDISISNEMSEQVSTPLRENTTEQESAYSVTTSLALLGFVSEEQLKQVGIIQELMAEGLINSDGSMVKGQSFMSFNRKV